MEIPEITSSLSTPRRQHDNFPDEITIQKLEAIVHSDIVLVQLETNYEALQHTIRLAQKKKK